MAQIKEILKSTKNQLSKSAFAIKKKLNSKKEYRIAIRVIAVILFLIGLYLVIYPLLPAIWYKLFQEGRETYPYKTQLQELTEGGDFANGEIPQDNRLVIPAIGVDMPIVEGSNIGVLNLGIWHRPGTGIPGSGNMVLTGHRVGYAFLPEDVRNATSFYNLDKLEVEDFVIVYWEGAEYDYQIYDFEVVAPSALHVEGQEGEERLTLYTCDPLGDFKERLVYYARPFEVGGV
jgi:LPXTG-site transpeptidase (sortase) family protein